MSNETSKTTKSTPPEKIALCRVTAKVLELPQGTAARGAVVRLKKSDYEEHKKDGNVQFLKYI